MIRFERSGTANGVYLIYDFYLKDELGDGERDLRVDNDNWG